jgi:hypothetical protein
MTPTSSCDGLIFLPSICYDCDEGRGDPTTCHYINITLCRDKSVTLPLPMLVKAKPSDNGDSPL